jgi:hypothetical protein
MAYRNRRFSAIAMVVLAILIAFWLSHRQTALAPKDPTIAGDPILSPQASRRMTWRPLQAVHPAAVALPKQQLAQADWLLPVTKSSSVAYVLHDGQARWLNEGQMVNLHSAPTDPIDQLTASANGTALSWPTPAGVELLSWPGQKTRLIPHAVSPYFETNRLAYLLNQNTSFTVVEGGRREHFVHLGEPFAHPFLADGVAFVRRGDLAWVQLSSRAVHQVATVNPAVWTTPISAGTIRQGLFMLLSRPSPIPGYLLIVDQAGTVRYFAWKSPTTPEAGVVNGRLALTYIRNGGQLVVVRDGSLTPLNVYPNLFSVGPYGLIWQPANGHFSRLAILP